MRRISAFLIPNAISYGADAFIMEKQITTIMMLKIEYYLLW